ncbi:ABC transporter vitamin B12 uptake permease [Xanthomonas oryzae pv. oryzae KACC 10331]|uniref:Glutathione peroxidase n=1 Tax=Xanthomonas oryzae pv. oryzae (strain KACC10331 / KXO85) TaxID=291331 RepID=Q5GTZ4_XANOR|nr:ABC transporter vitamin B12 uptake permease [Xanthomonas oryzae pv. oryzae KACC 10331]
MNQTLYDIPVTRIEGGPATLADYRGKVLLVVNVASKCGLTPQYEGLEALYRDKRAQGLEVLAFPANDFNGQEPGSEAEIAQFCRLTYDVTFPMFAKIAVTGEQAHPLYQALTSTHPHTTGDGPMREKLAGYGIAPNPRARRVVELRKIPDRPRRQDHRPLRPGYPRRRCTPASGNRHGVGGLNLAILLGVSSACIAGEIALRCLS